MHNLELKHSLAMPLTRIATRTPDRKRNIIQGKLELRLGISPDPDPRDAKFVCDEREDKVGLSTRTMDTEFVFVVSVFISFWLGKREWDLDRQRGRGWN